MHARRLLGAILAASTLALNTARAEFVVVVNPKNPAASLSAQQVAQIFLGRTGSFPGGGGRATPFDLREGAALRDEFYLKVADKNEGQVRAYWAKQLFSGNGMPPREVASLAEMKRAVANDVTAIGYLDRASLDSSVKEVLSVP
jgi:ABC-type phosphate transport system substrate-binding protein